MKKYLIMCLMTLCILMLAACGKREKYTVEIMIPAGSTADFVYSDTEICPTGNKITIYSGAGLGDTEVILKPVEVKQKTAYEPAYLTHGMPVKMDVEKGGWFKIGVSVQNDSDRGPIAVSVDVEGVEVRIAAKADGAPLAPADPDLDLESVSHIEVMSGLTGQKITIKDADSVQKVMDDIESLRYEKKNTVEEVGYAYRIRFYNENYDELGKIFITEENGHQISYDGYYYLVEADQNINVDYLEELLKDAPPAEPGDEGNDELPDIDPIEVICGYPTAEDMAVEESVTYNGKEYKTSELCNDTLYWLGLSEQGKMLSSYLPPEFMEFEENYGIILSLENLTSTGATIKCEQSGGEATGELETGSWYIVERWTQMDGWKEVETVIDKQQVGWTAEAYMILEDSTTEWEVNWEWLYGELPAGKYRIGKQIMDWRAPGDYDTVVYHVPFEIN